MQRVRHALLERLTRNPEVGELAVDLGISSRTLVRRLANVGVTYSDIKDELRKTHAAWYLQHTELSMEAIASQLGYNDPTSFSRKFKNWYRCRRARCGRPARRIALRQGAGLRRRHAPHGPGHRPWHGAAGRRRACAAACGWQPLHALLCS